MTPDQAHPSTGLPALDRILERLVLGDNVVWQVGSVEDYRPFVEPYCREALRQGRKFIYFHFERHEELIPPGPRVTVHRLDPAAGFETLTAEIHRVIALAGKGAYYLFDCLSDLAADWYSDMMLGNFFKVTCPYLREMDTIAYFALLRRRHSFRAVAAIRETTQLLLDVHRHEGEFYVHPLKVFERYSPTMYLPHVWRGGDFKPVTESAAISGIYEALGGAGSAGETDRFDLWDRSFQNVQHESPRRLLHMILSRNGQILDLAERYLTIEDVLAVRRRMIGTGLVGGKAAGMLIARAVLRNADPRWQQVLEPHDSFYVGSDVFYSYMVANGCWKTRQKQRDAATFLDGIEEAGERMLHGSFPEYVRDQFAEMLEYFGQAPIVVRSSSLLEDSFGNAFSGKYESVFCVNQGSPQDRLEAFLAAVRHIYASAMGREALLYRAQRGLLDRDEQMALLVQRVSGAAHGTLFFPQIAGVGLSYNPFAWSEQIDPKSGVLRLVFGLGTRAVRRADDDYTRVVALNAPLRRPESNSDDVRGYAQWRVDVLDLREKQLRSLSFQEVVESCGERAIEMVASRDHELMRRARETGRSAFPWVLTFNRLLSETGFVADMRAVLETLERAYDYPVDVEFAANFLLDGSYRINLVQCRPFQVKGGGRLVAAPPQVQERNVVFRIEGAVIGMSVSAIVGRLIYVVPRVYAELPMRDRYTIARLIGRITSLPEQPDGAVVLAGPGRWGTAEPALGVPVSFAEISRADALCEILEMREGLLPDVSLGTHFFNDLVERQILYLALVPGRTGNHVNAAWLEQAPNALPRLLPDSAEWAEAVRVIDASSIPESALLRLHADALRQQAVCYSSGV